MSRRTDMKRLMESPVTDEAENQVSSENSETYSDLSADKSVASPPPSKRAARSFGDAWKASQVTSDGKVSPDAAIDLDTDLLDVSFARDRVADSSDPSFSAFLENVREHGQRIPILVRKLDSGRYQIAYGHRRAGAAKALGRPVRAMVRALTDAELVLAQASENLARRDLSYIERAFFASNMAKAGIERGVIQSAMGSDEAQVSRYITVAEAIPADILAAIGPAPKVGRPRWDELVERIKADTEKKAEAAIAVTGFAEKPTDDRFAVVLAALAAKTVVKSGRARIWKDGSGRKIARIEETATRFTLSIDRKLEPELGDFLIERLDELLSAFKARKDKPDPQHELKGDE